MLPSNEKLIPYVQRSISATESGSLEWTQANPTTYVWSSRGMPRGSLKVQFVTKTAITTSPAGRRSVSRANYYLLQAFDGEGSLQFSVTGEEEPALNDVLKRLYDAAIKSVAERGLRFLDSILPPKDPPPF